MRVIEYVVTLVRRYIVFGSYEFMIFFGFERWSRDVEGRVRKEF